MQVFEYIRLALLEIWNNKLRTFLTLLGIVIGIIAVITIIFAVGGVEEFIVSELENIVPRDVLFANAENDPRTEEPRIKFDLEDLNQLREKEEFRALNIEREHSGEVRSPYDRIEGTIIGTATDFLSMEEMKMKQGRFINHRDLESRSRVAVLEAKAAEDLFGANDPLGEKIRFSGQSFRIIGVIEEKGDGIFGSFGGDRVVIPTTSYGRLQDGSEYPGLYARFTEDVSVEEAEDHFTELLDDVYGLTEEGESKFNVGRYINLEGMDAIFISLSLLLGGVASITLLVAGIGVMNIMLVIVTERKREIGLRKALGATRGNLVLQFLIESVILCLTGGVLGIAASFVIRNVALNIARQYIDIQAGIPLWAIILAFVFTAGVGLVFGIYPAYRASRLDPIEALEHE
ncbi:MAG: ABC transporter permease [Halanaerobiaceae bacterium]